MTTAAHRVLCCGGRRYADYSHVCASLDQLRQAAGDFAVIHGGAEGADSLCATWGKSKGLPVIRVDANWYFYDKGAGHVRNGWMLDFCFPTYAVAFPGGTGTADMIEQCEARGIPVWRP